MTTKRTRKPPVIVTTFDTLVRLATTEPVLVAQNRISHAQPHLPRRALRGRSRWSRPGPLGVASDARYHSGYVDPATRQQHWIYTAIRPLSEEAHCPTCCANASRRLFAQRWLS